MNPVKVNRLTHPEVEIHWHQGPMIEPHLARWEAFVQQQGQVPLSYHPAWLLILQDGLGHRPHCFEALADGEVVGLLPLAYLQSLLFGRFLVSLPYLNYGGVVARDDAVAHVLINQAVGLADRLGVRYLELRHERSLGHAQLAPGPVVKSHMRLELPPRIETLWASLNPKVRNQVRKAQKAGGTVDWGGDELLADFYAVFSRNMRDLGTPVFSRRLFQQILRRFAGRAEICVIQSDGQLAAAALVLHGWGVTEVPSASSLREMNGTCANMLLYWSLIERATLRGQSAFDFGRSSPGSGTYQFKKQWGARPEPAFWEYHVRTGDVATMRPESARNQRLIRLWKRLPVGLTRQIGPMIVRGIP